jgi:microcompartment protein CcmK/EutM
MTFGRVIGRVWCTVKDRHMDGIKLLIVQPLTTDLQPTGRRIICADSTGAGTGELVYWVRGKEASFPFHPAEPPLDTAIVGIVDSVHIEKEPEAPPTPAPPPAVEPKRKAGRK